MERLNIQFDKYTKIWNGPKAAHFFDADCSIGKILYAFMRNNSKHICQVRALKKKQKYFSKRAKKFCNFFLVYTDFRYWRHCLDKWRSYNVCDTHCAVLEEFRFTARRCCGHCGSQYHVYDAFSFGLFIELHTISCRQSSAWWRYFS